MLYRDVPEFSVRAVISLRISHGRESYASVHDLAMEDVDQLLHVPVTPSDQFLYIPAAVRLPALLGKALLYCLPDKFPVSYVGFLALPFHRLNARYEFSLKATTPSALFGPLCAFRTGITALVMSAHDAVVLSLVLACAQQDFRIITAPAVPVHVRHAVPEVDIRDAVVRAVPEVANGWYRALLRGDPLSASRIHPRSSVFNRSTRRTSTRTTGRTRGGQTRGRRPSRSRGRQRCSVLSDLR